MHEMVTQIADPSIAQPKIKGMAPTTI